MIEFDQSSGVTLARETLAELKKRTGQLEPDFIQGFGLGMITGMAALKLDSMEELNSFMRDTIAAVVWKAKS